MGVTVDYTVHDAPRKMRVMEPSIQKAAICDAEEILALQRLCYQSEAALYDDYSIPPLTQTISELLQEFENCRVLKAVLDDVIVGSVRGKIAGEICYAGRLIVHPRLQGMGLGTLLMSTMELQFREAKYVELFTGSLSLANLRLYKRLGYCEVRRVMVNTHLELVYLQKQCQ